MVYLGVMRGHGALAGDGAALGPAEYEIEGYRLGPTDIIASSEIRLEPAAPDAAFACRGLVLTTEQGRRLELRFTGKRSDASRTTAHAEVRGDLPPAADWRR